MSQYKNKIIIKSPREMRLMEEVGNILGEIFDLLKEDIKPGMSTYQISILAKEYMEKKNVKPTFKGYGGFPGYICTSVNSTLIHGIPSKDDIIKDGDIISLDMGCISKEGYQADACRTFPVGNISDEAKRLIRCTEECFFNALKVIKAGNRLNEISMEIQKTADEYGYSLVKEYGGHGLGREMHEEPFIYNYYDSSLGLGPILKPGMTLAVEPMVMQGECKINILDDDWTVVSKDGKLTCHYENDIIVTETGAIITSVDSNVRTHLKEMEECR
ncbi:MAG: type I methionyl aminopeptidase [Candidatus Enterosoma sp.]|nr:type I methionyl aminopeptidase [Candidatus Enterosoma sp.]